MPKTCENEENLSSEEVAVKLSEEDCQRIHAQIEEGLANGKLEKYSGIAIEDVKKK